MRQHTVHTPYMVGEVHFYSAEFDSGMALFDCGPPTDEGRRAIEAAVDLGRLKHLFLTHCHIDHYGLISMIERESGAAIWMPRADFNRLMRRAEHEAKTAEILSGLGFGGPFLQALSGYFERTTIMPGDLSRYRIVEDAGPEPLPGLGWIACPGHSQSDLAWNLGDEVVTGDILLRGIFQVPLLDLDLERFEGRFRNYEVWCESIGKMASFRGHRILPGHRLTAEVDGALGEYVSTMLQRAAIVARFRGNSLPDIIAGVFEGRLSDPFIVYLKVSEIVFMLDFLDDPGRLERALDSLGLMEAMEPLFEGATKGA